MFLGWRTGAPRLTSPHFYRLRCFTIHAGSGTGSEKTSTKNSLCCVVWPAGAQFQSHSRSFTGVVYFHLTLRSCFPHCQSYSNRGQLALFTDVRQRNQAWIINAAPCGAGSITGNKLSLLLLHWQLTVLRFSLLQAVHLYLSLTSWFSLLCWVWSPTF